MITGAASSMGRAAACLFAAHGARVALADLDGERAAQEILSAGGEALFVLTTVANRDSVDAMNGAVTTTLGPVNILYNNAGAAIPVDGGFTAFKAAA